MDIEREWAQIRAQLREKIAKAGQAVQIVHLTERGRPGSRPFMYTIGNYAHGLPELLIVDTDVDAFAGVLNRLGKIQRDRKLAFADEERVSSGGRFPLRIVDAGEIGRTEYASFVGLYYGTRDYGASGALARHEGPLARYARLRSPLRSSTRAVETRAN
jgi:uncharacterized protein DUF4262